MPFLDDLQKLTYGKYIFPVEVSLLGEENLNMVGSKFNELRGRHGEEAKGLIVYKDTSSVYSKCGQLKINNNAVIKEYLSLVDFFATKKSHDYKITESNKYTKEIVKSVSRTHKVIFLPQDIDVAKKLFSAVKKWIIDSKAVKQYGRSVVIKYLSAGFPVYSINDIDAAVEDFKKNLSNPRPDNIYNRLSPVKLKLVTNDKNKAIKGTAWRDLTSLESMGGNVYNTILDKNIIKNVFNEVVVSLPYFLALNEFLAHGKEENQSLHEYINTESGAKKVCENFSVGVFNIYPHSKKLAEALKKPKTLESTNFLTLAFSGRTQFAINKISSLDKETLHKWLHNIKIQPITDLSSPLKKAMLDDWIEYLGKEQKEINATEEQLSQFDITSLSASNGLIVSNSLHDYVEKAIVENLVFDKSKKDIVVRKLTMDMQETLECSSLSNKENSRYLFNFLLRKALENSASKEDFNVTLFSYMFILEALDKPSIFLCHSNFNSFSEIIYETLINVGYDLDKTSKVLYTLYTSKEIPRFTKKEWKLLAQSVEDISKNGDTELALIMSVYMKNTTEKNYVKKDKLETLLWEALYKENEKNSLFVSEKSQ